MSTSFRPVVEQYGSSSACFINPEAVEEILTCLCLVACPGGQVETAEHNQVNTVWIEGGSKFLDYVDSTGIDQMLTDCGDTKDLNAEDLRSLLGNIKALALEWRGYVDEGDGSLSFEVDQY